MRAAASKLRVSGAELVAAGLNGIHLPRIHALENSGHDLTQNCHNLGRIIRQNVFDFGAMNKLSHDQFQTLCTNKVTDFVECHHLNPKTFLELGPEEMADLVRKQVQQQALQILRPNLFISSTGVEFEAIGVAYDPWVTKTSDPQGINNGTVANPISDFI